MKKTVNNELFQSSMLTILISYTVFSMILTAETFLMQWETWPLIPIGIGVVASWLMHIQKTFSDDQRIWIYSALIMFTFFFYGSHRTSVFDTVAVMAIVLILYTMTGIKPLITFLQILYYVTFGYGLINMWFAGEEFDTLMITRAILHIAVITAISMIARTIISKWISVLHQSRDEIDQLTDATDRLNDFLANVSHEIRTPVNAVIGLTGICIDEEDNPEKLANLISVRDAGRRVAEQIGDILDYSEIDRSKLTNNYEDYMLASVLNDLVAEIRPFKPKNIELIIDIDPAIPSVMNTDISKLRKILRHLIINGLKYTHEGGVYVRISSEKEPYGVNLFIEVTDTGIGMTEEETERISERFYQADSGRSRKGGGLGLGMSIVSGFVASLGGFITIKSRPGAGTTVTVSLPQDVIDPAGCMSVVDPNKLCLGAFLHFDKFHDPNVREYYNNMVRNIVNGLGVQMHRVDNIGNLEKLLDSVKLTHLFVGEDEYLASSEQLEKLTSEMTVVVVANEDIVLPPGARAKIMSKPFYCFPVTTVLNAGFEQPSEAERGNMYCRGVTALVVDDEPMNLTVAKNIFKRYGMIVSTAMSGQESIDMCRERDFDIVFMDHMMPGMDGVTAMKHLRADKAKEHKGITIVALTANAVSTAKEMFLSEGFDGFVSKPIELVELERVMKRVLPSSVITYGDDENEKKAAAPEAAPQNITPSAEHPSATVASNDDTSDKTEKKPVDVVFDIPAGEGLASGSTAENPDDVYGALKALGIDTDMGLDYCLSDGEFYKSLLMQFADESDEKRGKMIKCFEEKDYENYKILVHALKSTSKMIGDIELSEKAKALEYAAKENRPEYIIENHESVMNEYRMLTDGIYRAYGITHGSGSGEVM